MKLHSLFLIAVALLSTVAFAEVKDSAPNGFTLVNTFTTKSSPLEVYRKIVMVGNWWDKEHTYSGDARNLTIDARAGGCWCEKLPKGGGSVLHMQVVTAWPGMFLVFRGGLGPLQQMGVSGAMTFKLSPASGGGTKVEFVYIVSGYTPGGLTGLAPMVDSVLMQQLARLSNYLDTGSAEAKK